MPRYLNTTAVHVSLFYDRLTRMVWIIGTGIAPIATGVLMHKRGFPVPLLVLIDICGMPP